MAESQTDDAPDAGEYDYDYPVSVNDEEKVVSFVEEALKNIRGQLRSNLREAINMTDRFDEDSEGVDYVLSTDNVNRIQVRARPLENPRVTVWLGDCPTWANDSWKDYIFPRGLNAYNGKTHVVFDVRPY